MLGPGSAGRTQVSFSSHHHVEPKIRITPMTTLRNHRAGGWIYNSWPCCNKNTSKHQIRAGSVALRPVDPERISDEDDTQFTCLCCASGCCDFLHYTAPGVIERKVAHSSSRERAVICADVLRTTPGIRAASRALRAARGRTLLMCIVSVRHILRRVTK